jgi:hypothetical protein
MKRNPVIWEKRLEGTTRKDISTIRQVKSTTIFKTILC